MSFSRDPSSGRLTQIDGPLRGGDVIAISPDGRVVYTGRNIGFRDTYDLNVYSRDPSSGLLTLERVYSNDSDGPLRDMRRLAVSPDGRELYVAQNAANALLVFDVDEATWTLSLRQSLKRTDIGALDDLVVAPGGNNVYVSTTVYALKLLVRDPTIGMLSPVASYSEPESFGRYDSGHFLAMAPDGSRLYSGRSVYDVWSRDSGDGTLTYLSQFVPDPGPCGNCARGPLLGTSRDGQSVFNATSRETWDENAVNQTGVTQNGVALERRYREGHELRGIMLPTDMAWSSDGSSAYMTAAKHHSGYPYGGDSGLTVMSWDQVARKLSFVEFVGADFPSGDPPRLPSFSINNGALYTNNPNVTLTLKPPRWAESLRIANDQSQLDDGGALRIRDDGLYEWRLDTTGAAPRDVRHVYVRVWTGYDETPIDLSDDIVLDQTAPQIQFARLRAAAHGSVLTVHAHDNRSGVHKMQVTTKRSKPGKNRKFTKHLTLSDPHRQLWVRVLDGARNKSRWRGVERH